MDVNFHFMPLQQSQNPFEKAGRQMAQKGGWEGLPAREVAAYRQGEERLEGRREKQGYLERPGRESEGLLLRPRRKSEGFFFL